MRYSKTDTKPKIEENWWNKREELGKIRFSGSDGQERKELGGSWVSRSERHLSS